MRDIIIASTNTKAAEHIRQILQSGQLFVENIFSSGAEVLYYASIRPGAVVVCGKLTDMPAVTLADMLPQNFDIVLLLPSGEPQTAFFSNMITLNMPLNRIEFLNTVRMLATTKNETYIRKEVRNESEEKLISMAKDVLMERHHLSEREAHKLLQRRSMETGMKMIDVARIIGEEQNEIY